MLQYLKYIYDDLIIWRKKIYITYKTLLRMTYLLRKKHDTIPTIAYL